MSVHIVNSRQHLLLIHVRTCTCMYMYLHVCVYAYVCVLCSVVFAGFSAEALKSRIMDGERSWSRSIM